MEVNEVTASPPSLAQLYTMFRSNSGIGFFYVTCPMRVVIFRELYMCLERRFASQNATAQRQMLITEMLPKRP